MDHRQFAEIDRLRNQEDSQWNPVWNERELSKGAQETEHLSPN
jgi:hypothetical protein